MNTYTRIKLAEEAGELTQAACKDVLHGNESTLNNLLGEMADVQAFILLALKQVSKKDKRFFKEATRNRIKHEKVKGKV